MAWPPFEKYAPQPLQQYHKLTRTAYFGLLIILVLLVIYESASNALYQESQTIVQNSAEVVIQRVFLYVGFYQRWILWLTYALLLIWAYWEFDKKNLTGLKIQYFPFAVFESLVYALFFGLLVSLMSKSITIKFLGPEAENVNLGAKMTLALGAGIYEELVFRLFLTGSLLSLFLHVMPKRRFVSKLLAVAISAALFSAFHYIGREQITIDSFAFRFYAGIVLGTLFIWRGIGIAAYTHAFYDLMLLFHK